MSKKLVKYLKQGPVHPNVILVEGARQVGKSTLVKQCLDQIKDRRTLALNFETDHAYAAAAIDRLDRFEDFTRYLKDEFKFEPSDGAMLFIDEAQECRQIARFIRSMKEIWTHTHVILSGSSMTQLFETGDRYPVGRVSHLRVLPFSFDEFLLAFEERGLLDALEESIVTRRVPEDRHQRFLGYFQRYLEIGGLPEVVLAAHRGEDWMTLRRNLYQSYRRDFIKVFDESTWSLIDRAMRAVANYVGGPSKATHVVKTNAPGYRRVPEIFSILEAWHMVIKVSQESRAPDEAPHIAPKRYLFDLGLLQELRLQAVPAIHVLETLRTDLRTPLGGMLENALALHMEDLPLVGWRTGTNGAEIDFVVKTEDGTFPIECKASLKLKKQHLSGLASYLAHYDGREGFLINLAPPERIALDAKRTIHALPIYLASEWRRFSGGGCGRSPHEFPG